jgi:hypothetical protein
MRLLDHPIPTNVTSGAKGDDTGYAKSLNEAIEKTNSELKPATALDGPLQVGHLYEPCHYSYVVRTRSTPMTMKGNAHRAPAGGTLP